MNRRIFLAAAAVMPLALASCGSLPSLGGDGASNAGAPYLATIRSQNGLSRLSPDRALEMAALRQAGYMAAAGKMTHTTGWRKDFATRIAADDIAGPAAENIAHGRMDVAKVFKMWMDSPPHRRNMLDPRFNRFGLASATASDGQRYWALVLGG